MRLPRMECFLAALSSQRGQIARFFAVSVMGGLVDAACGLLCLNYFGLNLYLSTTAGFLSGLLAGYLLHQFWTFSRTRSKAGANFLRFCLAYAGLLLLRYGIVALLLQVQRLLGLTGYPYMESLAYIAMLGISFFCNYVICNRFVFR